MENASKALLIAGAVLIGILLVSLGITAFSNTSDNMENVNLSVQQKAKFNSKFKKYEGTNISGEDVNDLIKAVINSNQNAIDNATNAYVFMDFPVAGKEGRGTGGKNICCIVGVRVDEADGKEKVMYYNDSTELYNTVESLQSHPNAASKNKYSWWTESLYGSRVTTGKTYTVTMSQKHGVVWAIAVKQN